MLSVSIITPSIGPGHFLPSAMQSVHEQGIPRLQHIVVADAAHDETSALLKPYQQHIIQVSKPCRSQAQAVNAGLGRASGDIIGWLNSDDIYYPRALPAVIQFFRAHPDVGLVYGHANLIDEKGGIIRTCRTRKWNPGRLRRRCFLQQPAVFFRREVLQRCGPLDQKLKYWTDYEYWLRLSDASVRFQRLSRVLAGSRIHPDIGPSSSKARNKEEAAAEEVVRMFRDRDGQVPTHWILRHARSMAIRDRLRGRNIRDGARNVFSYALRSERMWNQGRRGPMASLRLASRIALDEVEGRLKSRPRGERAVKRKMFVLRHHAPRALSLPDWYRRCRPTGETPQVSLVTPNFNGADYIEQTIRSVVEQTYPNLQYVLQDGGSTDSSVDVIRRHEAQLAHWESVPDRGQAHAINLGMQRATGEIMAYLNSDDLIMPGAVCYVANYFSRHPEIDVVYGHRILINENGDEIGRWVLPPHDDRALPWADYIPQETMFWRRRAWDRAGGKIDESFQFAMDWDLILRFREAGLRFARVPRFLGAFRVTEAQKTASLIQTVGKREMDRLRLRALGRVPTPREIHKVLKPYYRRQRVYDGLYQLGVARY